jgi:hypothetical protein
MALDHYISQVHLKRFYSPILGTRMYAMRKSNLKRFPPKADDVCRIEEGNTNKYLTEARRIEDFLKTIEGKYNASVESFERGNPTNGDIYILAGFLAYFLTCSPAAMRINSVPLRAQVREHAKLLDARGEIPPSTPLLGGKSMTELLDSGVVKITIDPKYPQAIGIDNILDRLMIFGDSEWELLINEHPDCPFFTSDFPVGIEASADPMVMDRVIPLTPILAARIKPDRKKNQSFDFNGFALKKSKLRRREAVAINRLLVRSAEDAVFFRDDLPWVPGFIEKNRHYRIDCIERNVVVGDRKGTWFRQDVVAYRQP